MTKISSKSIVAASANQKIPVSPDNAISPNTIKIYADAAVDLTTVQAVALGASADDGTLYRITGTGGSPLPTGIDNILIWGASSMAGGFDYGNARASVTALGVYVPCTYDVATNKISTKIPVYAINLTQTAGGDVNTVNKTFTNLLGETPVITKDGDGVININTTTFAFTQYQVGLFAPAIYDSGSTSLFVPTLDFSSANNLRVSMTKASDGTTVDDIYNNTYLEFYILIAN